MEAQEMSKIGHDGPKQRLYGVLRTNGGKGEGWDGGHHQSSTLHQHVPCTTSRADWRVLLVPLVDRGFVRRSERVLLGEDQIRGGGGS
jgi:hypothetical protein